MKIAKVEALRCDGCWRPWTFVRMETDGGLVAWGECSDNRSPWGIAGCVRDMADLLIGQDPRPVERLHWDMLRRVRQNSGGVSHKAVPSAPANCSAPSSYSIIPEQAVRCTLGARVSRAGSGWD